MLWMGFPGCPKFRFQVLRHWVTVAIWFTHIASYTKLVPQQDSRKAYSPKPTLLLWVPKFTGLGEMDVNTMKS